MFSGIVTAHQASGLRWSALSSFTFEAALVAAALAYPWFHPESLPPLARPLLLPLSTSAVTQTDRNTHAGGGSSTVMPPIVVSSHPLSFGVAVARPEERGAITAPDFNRIGVENSEEVLRSIVDDTFRPMPRPSPANPPRVSAVMEGNLIHRVEPRYPAIAQQLHIEGTVLVKAFISREGRIERAQAERGQAWLAQAALEAVRQWRFRPYYLNRQPVEVETEITVNFVLKR